MNEEQKAQELISIFNEETDNNQIRIMYKTSKTSDNKMKWNSY